MDPLAVDDQRYAEIEFAGLAEGQPLDRGMRVATSTRDCSTMFARGLDCSAAGKQVPGTAARHG
jgi:hypothetical protein